MTKKETGSGEPGYEVGHGKPPKHSRWKKKQSGNAKGRPNGSANVKTIMQRVVNEMAVELLENGTRRSVGVVEAMLRRQVREGLSGRLAAIANFLDRAERHLDVPSSTTPELPQEDADILKRAFERQSERGTVLYPENHPAPEANTGDDGTVDPASEGHHNE